MFKFKKSLNFRANKVNDQETQALPENSIFFGKREYFHNTKIDFFLINVNKFQYVKVLTLRKFQQNRLDRNWCTVDCLILPSKYYSCVFASAVARALKGC